MKSFQDRFREFRRPKTSTQETSVKVEYAFKSKRGRKKSGDASCSKKRRLEPPKGEDMTSFEKHNKLLFMECKKV